MEEKSKPLSELQAEFTQAVDAFIAKPDLNHLIKANHASMEFGLEANHLATHYRKLIPELAQGLMRFRQNNERLIGAAQGTRARIPTKEEERERYLGIIDDLRDRDRFAATLLTGDFPKANKFVEDLLRIRRLEAQQQQSGGAIMVRQ